MSSKHAHNGFCITPCNTANDVKAAADLFEAYVSWLDLDLSSQGFEKELASLPGRYATGKRGCLLLAKDDTILEVIGVVALRSLQVDHEVSDGAGDAPKSDRCEMKRLYVTPNGRGRGVGRGLAEAVIFEARRLGYQSIMLDTLPFMESARRLYKDLGFIECGKYYHYGVPADDIVFFCKDLT